MRRRRLRPSWELSAALAAMFFSLLACEMQFLGCGR